MFHARILVVEDRDTLRRLVERALVQEGYEVTTAASAEEAEQLLESSHFDLVLTDLKLPGADGLALLAKVRAQGLATPVVVLTAYGTVETAVEAMKLGAADFLEKPVEIDDLIDLVAGWTGSAAPESAFAAPGAPVIVGSHPKLRAALRLLERVAATDSTVLLSGASGTGKELFARALHALSPRREGPFVALNCAAIPESLIENELFGHERGAFTGADRRQTGRFELARGGTLFLDEIGELPPAVQSKVLRVLEEKTFEPIGGRGSVAADVRLVAASNRDLKRMVEEGTFRADLFYRLDVFPIVLPSLAERAEDVPVLADHLLGRLEERGHPRRRLSVEAREWLKLRSWPGNVRELGNLLERAVIVSEREQIGVADLEQLATPRGDRGGEESRLREALVAAEGDKRRAAAILGMSYRTLLRRIKEHGLEGFPKYRS